MVSFRIENSKEPNPALVLVQQECKISIFSNVVLLIHCYFFSVLQASFKFSWSLDSGHYSVIDSDPLKEVNMFKVFHSEPSPVIILSDGGSI